MIHAACSNSNHLQPRQKPDADKGWRNQCRLGTAILLIPSAFPSEHLCPQERRLLLILDLLCLLGLPGKIIESVVMCRGKKTSLRSTDVRALSLRLSSISDTLGRTGSVTCTVAQNSLWLPLGKAGT